jgi:uncharacterized LabA/DUF88 family protein
MIFVDGQNLYHAQTEYFGGEEIDFERFKDILSDDHELIRPYYFDSYKKGNYKQGFYHYLNMVGYRVEAQPLVERNGVDREKGADIRLATELIAQGFNDSYDIAIVVTGDRDFERAVNYVQDQGKRVIGVQFENNMSGDLKPVFDEYIKLDDIASEIRQQ